jgi:DnaJ-class molecular chaperone
MPEAYYEDCDTCDGTGLLTTDHIDDFSSCMNCLGSGRQYVDTRLKDKD